MEWVNLQSDEWKTDGSTCRVINWAEHFHSMTNSMCHMSNSYLTSPISVHFFLFIEFSRHCTMCWMCEQKKIRKFFEYMFDFKPVKRRIRRRKKTCTNKKNSNIYFESAKITVLSKINHKKFFFRFFLTWLSVRLAYTHNYFVLCVLNYFFL